MLVKLILLMFQPNILAYYQVSCTMLDFLIAEIAWTTAWVIAIMWKPVWHFVKHFIMMLTDFNVCNTQAITLESSSSAGHRCPLRHGINSAAALTHVAPPQPWPFSPLPFVLNMARVRMDSSRHFNHVISNWLNSLTWFHPCDDCPNMIHAHCQTNK